ncbi:MAG: L,D-transpeptidase [Mesorhizobium sp.]|nr:L,D-transpeptidase [Mesorhizobium sp.]
MKFRNLILSGLMGAIGFSAPALAESANTVSVTTTQKIASATQPTNTVTEKNVVRKTVAKTDDKEKTNKTASKDAKGKKEEIAAAPTELRSDTQERGLFATLFGGAPQMLEETRRRDQELREREIKKAKKFQVKPEFMPQSVAFDGGYKRGTIVINTKEKFLYLVESSGTARRYAIAVGREGLLFTGKAKIADKQEWPRWIPTKDMQKREPQKYGQYKDGMPGGPDNPLGARAMYLYQGKQDTHIRIHGTTQPWTIGTNSSNGCFRMVNEHVMDLYNRVKLGTEVVVL